MPVRAATSATPRTIRRTISFTSPESISRLLQFLIKPDWGLFCNSFLQREPVDPTFSPDERALPRDWALIDKKCDESNAQSPMASPTLTQANLSFGRQRKQLSTSSEEVVKASPPCSGKFLCLSKSPVCILPDTDVRVPAI